MEENTYLVIAVEYIPEHAKTPATLDIALEDPERPNGVRYTTLHGAAAKKFSTLQAGEKFEVR